MSQHAAHATVAQAVADGFISVAFAAVVVYCLWPWDWLGRRRGITVKRDRRPFE